MSIQEYHARGIGFYTQDVTGEALSKFLFQTHKESLRKMENYSLAVNLSNLSSELASMPEYDEETFLDYIRDCTHTMTYAEAICQILNAELDIHLVHAGVDECDKEAVFFKPDYPWHYSANEKHLSRESLEEKLEPYARELGTVVEDVRLIFIG